MKLLCLLFAIASIAPVVSAQTLAESFRDPQWSTYIFVSTKMPRASLVTLAREAVKAKALLVLNGFDDKQTNTTSMQKLVAGINEECCGENGAAWSIHPKLFERYGITGAPTFVIARGTGNQPADFSMVAGDMSLANALKYFSQESKLASIRVRAGTVYRTTFTNIN